MIAAPIHREQMLRIARAFDVRSPDARVQLAHYFDDVAASTGDPYFAGLADALRVERPTVNASTPIWNN